jgi:diguanylate cyclase (GGDEF)-like protein
MSQGRISSLAALLLALLPTWSAAAEAVLDEAMQNQLARLVQQAQQQPEAALQALKQLRGQGNSLAAAPNQVRYAEAQIHLAGGDTAAASVIAKELAREPTMSAQALMLSAGVAERLGRTTEAALSAQQALTQLDTQCLPSDEARAKDMACDFRSAAAALRLLSDVQRNRGALVQALTLSTRSLALLQAGNDRFLTVHAMGNMAVLSQSLEKPADAEDWLTKAGQLAEGDALLMATVKTFEAVVAGRNGDKAGLLRAQQEGLTLARQAGAVLLVARAQANLTDYYMTQQSPERALALAREALPVLQRFNDLRYERTLRHNMTVTLLRLHQFDAARREMARIEEIRQGQSDTTLRIRELRELGEAWAAAGQPKEAITLFHIERQLTADANARNREASLDELRLKYDSTRKQRDLDLLNRELTINNQQLGNRRLASQVSIAVAVLFGLSLVLAAVMVRKVRAANKRLKANQSLLRAQSERDPLTDLANRRHFLAVMAQQSAEQAMGYFKGALLMVDIDHFKRVNDEHGHGIGDVVICEVARRLCHAVREGDLVVRWGGEEFLIYAPAVSADGVAHLAERVLQSVGSAPIATEDGPLPVTVSIGFAHFPLPPGQLHLHWEQAVNWADMALYTAKAQGRNRAMGIARVNATDSSALVQIEADFDAACSSDQVALRAVLGPAAPPTPAEVPVSESA